MSELIRREDVQREIQSSFDGGAFRWQDGQDLMDRINDIPAASPWRRVEEKPRENGKYVAINVKTNWWYEASYENGIWKAVDLFCQRWVVIHPTHWMPIEPPKEDA